MSKRVFRLILAAYLVFETAASFSNAFFGVRVPADIVRQLYGVFRPAGSAAPMANGRSRRHLGCVIHLGGHRAVLILAECSPSFRYSASHICGHRSSQALLYNFWLV